jgi:Xaa-Pro aminopeptidase
VTGPGRSEPGVPPGEYASRRERLAGAVAEDALLLVRGGSRSTAMRRFRQSNELYYLTGVEVPGAYLLVDCGSGASTLYLPHRDARTESVEGRVAAAEDADELCEALAVSRVAGVPALARDLARAVMRSSRRLYTPFAPGEGERVSRDTAFAALGERGGDPFDDASTAEGRLVGELRRRFPQLEVRDLSPALDRLRVVKSPHELELLREAARLTGTAVMEAVRATAPGVGEWQLAAVAELVFRDGGARGGAYEAIVASGTNAYFPHYVANEAVLQAGELVLMDYAPDYRYYTSDIGRMWPVDGRYSDDQRRLYGFVVAYHRALLAEIRPGRTACDVMDAAAEAMRPRVAGLDLGSPARTAAAESMLRWRGHLSHPVGMAVHDVGDYHAGLLEPGHVFSVDPTIVVPEERLYLRVEDTVAVTDTGLENLTGFVPLEPDDLEALWREPGLLQLWQAARDGDGR